MTPDCAAWLPATALLDGVLEAQIADAVNEWQAMWFGDNLKFNEVLLSENDGEQTAAGAEIGWVFGDGESILSVLEG